MYVVVFSIFVVKQFWEKRTNLKNKLKKQYVFMLNPDGTITTVLAMLSVWTILCKEQRNATL